MGGGIVVIAVICGCVDVCSSCPIPVRVDLGGLSVR